MRVKCHTFNGNNYKIELAESIDGVCDLPDDDDDPLVMVILEGDNFRAFSSAVHEGLHAMLGRANDLLHDNKGESKTEDFARFLWRMRGRWK